MPKAYRAEFFDNALNFVAWAQVDNAPIAFDYLTLEETTVSTNKPLYEVSTLNLCRIVSNDGTKYSGVVSSTTASKTGSSISIKPLLSLFDVTCFFDRTKLQTMSLENFIAEIMESLYTSDDALQNISGFTAVPQSETLNAKLNLKDNVNSLFDILTSALKKYGIVVTVDFDPKQKTVTANIGKVESKNWVIEADLSGCTNVTVDFSDGLSGINKLTLINKNDESQKAVYYLHPNGTVDTNNENRITPVQFSYELLESDDFETEAAEQAENTLKPEEYNNLIELSVLNSNKIVRWSNHEIGEPVTVIYKGAQYKSVFTGWNESGQAVTLTFGAVRLELTKKLILERRKSN